ncbi:amidase signature enzyme [Amanita muscaria]
MLFSTAHRKACALKQQERQQRIDDLPSVYQTALTDADKVILNQPVKALVEAVQSKALSPKPGVVAVEPLDILRAYGKKALLVHNDTNCLTEVMIGAAEKWAKTCNRQGPLAGVPISLKDTVGIEGWDYCVGYSARIGKPAPKDSSIVRLLRDAGAVPFVKTNLPITLLSFESASDIFGTTNSPYKATHTPGGSSGGEAALLALGGSRIGIGSDGLGSLRVPAHYSGVYSIRPSFGRFPIVGNAAATPGQEGVPGVFGPLARTLEDLETVWKAIQSMKPWEYDHTCVPIPWRTTDLSQQKLRWGVMWDDGIVAPSPACERALGMVVDILKTHGHDVVDAHPPSPLEGLSIASQLVLADGGVTASRPMRLSESNTPGMVQAFRGLSLPRFVKKIWIWWLRYIKRDNTYATLLEGWHAKTMPVYLSLVAKREQYRARWHQFLNDEKLDFVLCVPNPLPAQRHGQIKEGWKSCNYTFLFNLLDYSAGVVPVTHVDRMEDTFREKSADYPILGSHKPRNAIERSQEKAYDAVDMHGLPVGVQIVGRKFEEEKVLEGMKVIERLLRVEGKGFAAIPV